MKKESFRRFKPATRRTLHQKRNDSIIEAFNAGQTYESIGDKFGLSRQRIFQIVSGGGRNDGRLISISEVQRRLGISRVSVQSAISGGLLKTVTINSRNYVVADSIEEFLK